MLLQLDSPTTKRANHAAAVRSASESYPSAKKQEKSRSGESSVEKCAACQEPAYGFMVVSFQ